MYWVVILVSCSCSIILATQPCDPLEVTEIISVRILQTIMFHWRHLSVRRPLSLASFEMGKMTTILWACHHSWKWNKLKIMWNIQFFQVSYETFHISLHIQFFGINFGLYPIKGLKVSRGWMKKKLRFNHFANRLPQSKVYPVETYPLFLELNYFMSIPVIDLFHNDDQI